MCKQQLKIHNMARQKKLKFVDQIQVKGAQFYLNNNGNI